MESTAIIKRPVITEKATAMREKENKYVFIVANEANKQQIKQAVEELFKVDVVGVHTIKASGKIKKVGAHSGYTPDYKKAIVKIKSGQNIKITEGV